MTLFDQERTAAPAGPTVRVKLVVAYDGSGFRGFARQPGVKTVGGTLTVAIERVLGHAVELTCAGRTDAGVHGWGQVVSFDALADASRNQMPLLVLVAQSDMIISGDRSRALFDQWAGPKTWQVVPQVDHNSLGASDLFWQRIARFLAER